MDPDLLLENIVSTVKTAKAFGVPIMHSTVNVASGRGAPTSDGLPRRSVTGTRSSAIQGDGKGWPEPARSGVSVEDQFCGTPVARITVIR